MDNEFSELPDEAIVAFNSNYKLSDTLNNPRGKKINSSQSIEDVVQDMAAEIWRVCYYLVGGSPKKEKIYNELIKVFRNGQEMILDSWGASVNIIVKPPNKTTNKLDRNLGQNSIFQFGHLIFEVIGNPQVQTSDGKVSVVSRLTNLFSILNQD